LRAEACDAVLWEQDSAKADSTRRVQDM